MKRIIITVLLLTAACSPGFDDPRQVNDLRVLAVRTDPPETIYGLVPPGTFETEITFLVASPDKENKELTWRLWGCGIEPDDIECEPDQRVDLGSGTGLPGEITTQVTLTEDLIKASFEAEPYNGMFGAAVWIQGEVTQEGEEPARFLKSVLFSPDAGLGRTANSNPRVDGIIHKEGDEEDDPGDEAPLPLDDQGRWHADRDKDWRLTAVVPEEDRETYILPTLDFGEEVDLENFDPSMLEDVQIVAEEVDEDITYRFYTTIGSLSVDSKTEAINVFLETEEDKADKDLSVVFRPPDEPGEGTLWIIVEDGHGGIGWVAQPVVVD